MPPHVTLRPKQLIFAVLTVTGGGAVGTIIRDLLLKLQPASTGADWTEQIPWVLLSINLDDVIPMICGGFS